MIDKLDVPMWAFVVCANVHQAAGSEVGFWCFFVLALALAAIRFGRIT